MFDIIIHPPISGFDGTNILLACLAGHLTIFAFGYPYIYRAITNLSNISTILTNRIKNNSWRKYYSRFIIVAFVINLFSLLLPNIVVISIFSSIILFLHIVYVMHLYKIIENGISNPFELIINKDIHESNSQFKSIAELENDITLVIDLICYFEKNTFSEADELNYFIWLINATILKFKNFNTSNYDSLVGLNPNDYKTLFSTLHKVQWLNQWAVEQKRNSLLYNIDGFYYMLLEYGLPHNKNIDYSKYPILNTIENIDQLYYQYSETDDIDEKYLIQRKCDFIKYIQNKVLEFIKQIYGYRIIKGFMSIYHTTMLVNFLYFVLQRKINKTVKNKYEPCFSIVAKMIDCGLGDEYYQELIRLIKNNHDYFWGETYVYSDICGFHINILAYLIFKNQYQTLKSYMHYEEPKERVSQHTRPQIPNTVNNITRNFIGHDSVFCNTQTFSANTSSYKYKFYVLFLLLAYSKGFADKKKLFLSRLNKNDLNYKFTEEDIEYHSKCSVDFKNMNFDILMSNLTIKNYKEFFEEFKKETELLNLFEFREEDQNFITNVLDDIIEQIKRAQNNLLKCKFKNLVFKEFSLIKQKELGCKNLDEFINSKIHKFLETIKSLPFKGNDNNLLKKTFWNVYEKTFSKRKILSGGYSYLFAGEPNKDFYSRLFSFIVENCQEIDDIKNIPSNIENYEILSNFDYKRNFENFGFNKTDIKVRKTFVNGVENDDFEHADVSSIKINDKEIKISQYNNNFHFLNIDETNSHLLILFNPEKITIQIGDLQPIRYEDLKGGQVKIIDDTQITISLPKDKSLGYYFLINNRKNH